jgi:Cu2+-exporting ATPase
MSIETIKPAARDTTDDRSPSCCTHCGAPVPAGLVRSRDPEQFCCDGCRAAYSILRDCGLDDFYAIRERCGIGLEAVDGSSDGFELFDDPGFVENHVTRDAAGRFHVRLGVPNIHCAACVWLLEKLPRLVPGVIEARVDVVRATLSVTWDNTAASLSDIAAVLAKLGYPPHPLGTAEGDARSDENRRQLIRLAVAGACAGNAMLIAFALYAGMFSTMASEHATLFRVAGTLIGLIAIGWPGSVFFRGAWAALRTRTPHMDVPVALGLAVGGTAGLANAVTGRGESYFDTLSLLVFLLLVGRYLLFRGRRTAIERVSLLNSLTPHTARRVESDGSVRTVPADSLCCGDVVEVRAGELIPGDGEVIGGTSSIDEGLLTGESCPRAVATGESVPAGATNLSALLRVRITAIGAASRIGRIMGLVEDAAGRKPQWVLFADRISGWFVAVVLTLAAITAWLWWSTSATVAVDHTVALLIVACPCALGLATPLTLAVAQGRAAKRGILIKSADVAEQLARPGRVWLDKTGTLTEGRMTVRDWIGSADVKPLVVAFELQVAHPIADALVRGLGDSADPSRISSIEHVVGGGLSGHFNRSSVVIGSESFVRSRGCAISSEVTARMDDWLRSAWTPVLVAIDGSVTAAVAVGDSVRSDAASSIAELRRLGWTIGVLSGDHPAIVAAVAREVGIPERDALGGLSPEEKLLRIEAARERGTVVMVGDGVNDTAALAAASVGVAVHGGAEVSLKAADVYIARPGLAPLVELARGGRRTVRIIRSNFAASLTYNLVAVALAMSGHVNPLVAAILMPISSLTVLGLALGGRTFTPAITRPSESREKNP